MSGIVMRIAFGYQKDPYGNNAGLMQKCKSSTASKQVMLMYSEKAMRQKQEERNAEIEAEIFNRDPDKKPSNPGRFRK